MPNLQYLAHYPEELKAQVWQLITEDRLGEMLDKKYPARHDIRTDKALYDYVLDVKTRFMRSTEPLSKVVFDNSLRIIKKALGTHTTVSRVQGGKLKSKREIRVASLFKTAPPEFLHIIVVHELAHLKERFHHQRYHPRQQYPYHPFQHRQVSTQRSECRIQVILGH